MTRVHIVWDNSNIFVSGKEYCVKLEQKEHHFRINFNNLIDLAVDGRVVEQVFCVGSVPPATDAVWTHIERKTGKAPERYERGAASGKEQAVDQALQVRMLRLGYDYNPPECVVLLTGDGRGIVENVGFFADAKRLHSLGWQIEVLAWKNNCAVLMHEWAEENGVFIDLGDFYSSVTFLENGMRKVRPIDYPKRPRL